MLIIIALLSTAVGNIAAIARQHRAGWRGHRSRMGFFLLGILSASERLVRRLLHSRLRDVSAGSFGMIILLSRADSRRSGSRTEG
jgi:NADH:ubiquinone oxidoreductase subunit 2 (subunit N)